MDTQTAKQAARRVRQQRAAEVKELRREAERRVRQQREEEDRAIGRWSLEWADIFSGPGPSVVAKRG